MGKDTIFCMNCGQKLPAEAKFCFVCGQSVETGGCQDTAEVVAENTSCQQGDMVSPAENDVTLTLAEFREQAPSQTGFREQLLSFRKSLPNSWDYNAFVGILLGVGGPKHGDAACMNFATGQGDNGNNTKKTLEARGLMPVFTKYRGKKISPSILLSDVEEEIISAVPDYEAIRKKFHEIVFAETGGTGRAAEAAVSDEPDPCDDDPYAVIDAYLDEDTYVDEDAYLDELESAPKETAASDVPNPQEVLPNKQNFEKLFQIVGRESIAGIRYRNTKKNDGSCDIWVRVGYQGTYDAYPTRYKDADPDHYCYGCFSIIKKDMDSSHKYGCDDHGVYYETSYSSRKVPVDPVFPSLKNLMAYALSDSGIYYVTLEGKICFLGPDGKERVLGNQEKVFSLQYEAGTLTVAYVKNRRQTGYNEHADECGGYTEAWYDIYELDVGELAIRTPEGSAAETYAKENHIPIETIAVPKPKTPAAQENIQETDPSYFYVKNCAGGCCIARYEGPDEGIVVIPSRIGGKKVIEIGESAFIFWFENVIGIVIPDGVRKIHGGAFAFCTSLSAIGIPGSVTEIGDGAFDHCDNLHIFAPSGSYAEQYAEEHGILFQPL